jgi:hypothetical protein
MIGVMEEEYQTIPSSLIDEPIEVAFAKEPTFEKCPDCPKAFTWRGETHAIVKLLSERQDNERRGRYANNMTPEHLSLAQRMGSWGVGRYSFTVEVEGGRIFEIYYDRSPRNAGDRKGHWVIKGERVKKPRNNK